MKWGTAIVLTRVLAAGIAAQAANLDFPLERQVFQRNAQERAEVKVAGAVPANAALVEAKAELGAGLRGRVTDRTVAAQGAQIKAGTFSGSLKLATGGWYSIKVRFRKSATDQVTGTLRPGIYRFQSALSEIIKL